MDSRSVLIFAYLLFSPFLFLFSQDIPEIIKIGKRPEYFVPKGWDIIGKIKGDLNRDKIEDIVLAIKDVEEDMNDDKDYPRMLLVLFGTQDKSFNLYASSVKVVMCKKCGGVTGDPFQSIDIKNGELSIIHFGGSTDRWGISDIFKWDGKDIVLINETRSTSNANDPENSYQEKIKTATDFGKIPLQSFDIKQEK